MGEEHLSGSWDSVWNHGLHLFSVSVRSGAGFLKSLQFLAYVSVLDSSVRKEAVVGHQVMLQEFLGSCPEADLRMSSGHIR